MQRWLDSDSGTSLQNVNVTAQIPCYCSTSTSANSTKLSQDHESTGLIHFFIPTIKRITGLQNFISIYLLYSGSIWETALFPPMSRSQLCNTNSISATSQTSDSFSSWLEILQVWLLLAWLVHRAITLTPYNTCQCILKLLHVIDSTKVSPTEINKQLYLKKMDCTLWPLSDSCIFRFQSILTAAVNRSYRDELQHCPWPQSDSHCHGVHWSPLSQQNQPAAVSALT